MADISNTEDVIDVRDIIARFEELDKLENDELDDDEAEELTRLGALLDNLRTAGGGDEQWRGDWYPLTLIRDTYFEDHARELADDLYGEEMRSSHWPFSYIDWEAAATALQQDYTSIDYDGVDYWTR